jgi:hypothetical protein
MEACCRLPFVFISLDRAIKFGRNSTFECSNVGTRSDMIHALSTVHAPNKTALLLAAQSRLKRRFNLRPT